MDLARSAVASIPRLPVFGWHAFAGERSALIPSVLERPKRVFTTSGRAAIALALRVLGIGRGDRMLLPTYHCPTMIAPVVRIGAAPVFYPITESGGPALDFLAQQDLNGVRAMVVVHFFGLPQAMASVRAFCDRHGIALIEDCAHALFGTSDGRPVGAWGDLAIASLTKFLPVTEGGCLVSNSLPLDGLALEPRRRMDELKALLNSIELGSAHGRLQGFNTLLRGGFRLLGALRGGPRAATAESADVALPPPSAAEYSDELLWSRLTNVSRWIVEATHRSRIVALRRRNYGLLAQLLDGLPGARAYRVALPEGAAPYVFPLEVENAAARYPALRAARVPLFRWDRIWPGTPAIERDHGLRWATEMFQLGCHQDMFEEDVRALAETVRRIFDEVR
jgi:dTDP-4-amino-4,6-dideoxygalactose transaminase